MRPVKGAVMRVWSRSNRASRTAARASSTAAWAARCSATFWPAFSTVPAPGLLQGFCTRQLAVRETETRAGAFELSRGPAEFDLIRGAIDQEHHVRLLYGIAG